MAGGAAIAWPLRVLRTRAPLKKVGEIAARCRAAASDKGMAEGNTELLGRGPVIEGACAPRTCSRHSRRDARRAHARRRVRTADRPVSPVLLDHEQFSQVRVIPVVGVFDGSPVRFRLGVEAHRLALAYGYDPFLSLSTSKVDPLHHQVEAVYNFMLPLPRIRLALGSSPTAGSPAARSVARELADRFAVSRQATSLRLETLGVVMPSGSAAVLTPPS